MESSVEALSPGKGQTFFRVDLRRDRELVQQTLGPTFGGVFVSDYPVSRVDATPTLLNYHSHQLRANSMAKGAHATKIGEPFHPYEQ